MSSPPCRLDRQCVPNASWSSGGAFETVPLVLQGGVRTAPPAGVRAVTVRPTRLLNPPPACKVQKLETQKMKLNLLCRVLLVYAVCGLRTMRCHPLAWCSSRPHTALSARHSQRRRSLRRTRNVQQRRADRSLRRCRADRSPCRYLHARSRMALSVTDLSAFSYSASKHCAKHNRKKNAGALSCASLENS